MQPRSFMRHKAASSLAQGYDPGDMLPIARHPKWKHKRGMKFHTRKKLMIQAIEQKLRLSGRSAIKGQLRIDLKNHLSGLKSSDSERSGASLDAATRLMASGKCRSIQTPLKYLGRKEKWRPKWKKGGKVRKRPDPTETMPTMSPGGGAGSGT